jgi:hypothetical protein
MSIAYLPFHDLISSTKKTEAERIQTTSVNVSLTHGALNTLRNTSLAASPGPRKWHLLFGMNIGYFFLLLFLILIFLVLLVVVCRKRYTNNFFNVFLNSQERKMSRSNTV